MPNVMPTNQWSNHTKLSDDDDGDVNASRRKRKKQGRFGAEAAQSSQQVSQERKKEGRERKVGSFIGTFDKEEGGGEGRLMAMKQEVKVGGVSLLLTHTLTSQISFQKSKYCTCNTHAFQYSVSSGF